MDFQVFCNRYLDINDGSESEIEEFKVNYEVVSLIAKGYFGRVFKVQENTTEKFFALKLIRKPKPVEDEDDEESVGNYTLSHVETEKRILENIGYHPFLVTLHNSFETCNHVGLLMNFVKGITMLDYISDISPKLLSEDHAAFYIAELSLALHYLHKKGIIHRDVKFENVIIDLDGHVKLIDYGCAIDGLSFQKKTSRYDVIYNFTCMAPEIVGRQPYNHQCDWYALGVILCRLITGKHPFAFASIQNYEDEDEDDELTHDDYKSMIEGYELTYDEYKTVEDTTSLDFQSEKGSISEEAHSLLVKLLHWNPMKRVGIHDDESRMEIAEHSFLNDINWAKLERREVDAPFKPIVKNVDQSKDPAISEA